MAVSNHSPLCFSSQRVLNQLRCHNWKKNAFHIILDRSQIKTCLRAVQVLPEAAQILESVSSEKGTTSAPTPSAELNDLLASGAIRWRPFFQLHLHIIYGQVSWDPNTPVAAPEALRALQALDAPDGTGPQLGSEADGGGFCFTVPSCDKPIRWLAAPSFPVLPGASTAAADRPSGPPVEAPSSGFQPFTYIELFAGMHAQ